jgi:hypothetical protein
MDHKSPLLRVGKDKHMKKFYKAWMAVAALLILLAAYALPVWAEETVGGEILPPMEDVGDGETAPDEEGENANEPGAGEESPPPTEDEVDKWSMDEVKAYINGTVIPAAVMVVTALGALYVALVPVFNKIKLVMAKFNSASDEITATAGESRKTKEQTKATLDKLRGDYEQLHKDYELMCARYETMAQGVSADMTAMKQELSDKTARVVELSGKLEKMMVVAFCNNRELMEKGYARRIAQIGAGVEVDVSELVEATGEDKPSLEASGDEGEEADNEQDGIEKAS